MKDKPASVTPINQLENLFGDYEVTHEDVKDVQDSKFIINNLIIAGHVVVLVAAPNCGKTALLVYLAPQIASQGYRLIYMNFDAGATEIARHHRLAQRDGYKLIAPDIKVGKSIEDVLKVLDSMSNLPDLSDAVIVIDTLKKCTDVINKRASKAFYKTLRSISAKGGTVILAAHANKYRDNDNNLIYEGTGDLRSDVDDLIYMEYQKGQEFQTITTYPDKVRGVIRRLSFQLNLKTREIFQLQAVVDVKQGILAARDAKRNDPDGDIRTSVLKAIHNGKVIQKDIVDFCISKDNSRRKVVNTLKQGANKENPFRFLSVTIGDKNAKIYAKWSSGR